MSGLPAWFAARARLANDGPGEQTDRGISLARKQTQECFLVVVGWLHFWLQ